MPSPTLSKIYGDKYRIEFIEYTPKDIILYEGNLLDYLDERIMFEDLGVQTNLFKFLKQKNKV